MTNVGTALNFNVDEITGECVEVHNDVTFDQRVRDIITQEENEKRNAKIDKNSPYRSWTQCNDDGLDDISVLIERNSKAARILLFLIKNMDGHNAIICSSRVLEEALNCSESTVARAIKFLKDNNFIKIAKSGTANVYYVNAEIAWKSWGKNQQYAEFSAKVIIAKSEQEQPAPTIKKQRVNMVEIKEIAHSS